MQKFENIGDWVEKTYGTQKKAAEALGTKQNVISQWVSGRSRPSREMQKLLQKKGFSGPFEKPAVSVPLSREDFVELRGAVKQHIEQWERGEEKVLLRLEALAQRIAELERRAGISK